MENVDGLLTQAKSGIDSLGVSKKYVDSAMKWLGIWLTDDVFSDYVPQIKHLIKAKNWEFLLDSFYQVIPFGTGGRRGLVGVGPNRINTWTVQASAQGHAQYLIKQFGDQAKRQGIVLTYDVRKYNQKGIYADSLPNPVMNLDCKQLAVAAADHRLAVDVLAESQLLTMMESVEEVHPREHVDRILPFHAELHSLLGA